MRSNSKKHVGKTLFSENITTKINKMKDTLISGERYEKSATPKSSVGSFISFWLRKNIIKCV